LLIAFAATAASAFPAEIAEDNPSVAVVQEEQAWVPVREIVNPFTGEVFAVNEDSIDARGCLIGPSGDAVCASGAVGSSGQDKVTYSGNVGHAGTGSNGNSAPVDAATGLQVDPAAVTYLKQLERYREWELREAARG